MRLGYHARRGNAEKAKRSLRRLYGNVPSYDVEREYTQMASTIEVERRDHGGAWWTEYRDCFVGSNGQVVAFSIHSLEEPYFD